MLRDTDFLLFKTTLLVASYVSSSLLMFLIRQNGWVIFLIMRNKHVMSMQTFLRGQYSMVVKSNEQHGRFSFSLCAIWIYQ